MQMIPISTVTFLLNTTNPTLRALAHTGNTHNSSITRTGHLGGNGLDYYVRIKWCTEHTGIWGD